MRPDDGQIGCLTLEVLHEEAGVFEGDPDSVTRVDFGGDFDEGRNGAATGNDIQVEPALNYFGSHRRDGGISAQRPDRNEPMILTKHWRFCVPTDGSPPERSHYPLPEV
jgi:hypothetical protein